MLYNYFFISITKLLIILLKPVFRIRNTNSQFKHTRHQLKKKKYLKTDFNRIFKDIGVQNNLPISFDATLVC